MTTQLRINGRVVEPGTEITVWDTPNRRRKHRYTVLRILNHEQIECVGGPRNHIRSFAIERIATVHRQRKLRQ